MVLRAKFMLSLLVSWVLVPLSLGTTPPSARVDIVDGPQREGRVSTSTLKLHNYAFNASSRQWSTLEHPANIAGDTSNPLSQLLLKGLMPTSNSIDFPDADKVMSSYAQVYKTDGLLLICLAKTPCPSAQLSMSKTWTLAVMEDVSEVRFESLFASTMSCLVTTGLTWDCYYRRTEKTEERYTVVVIGDGYRDQARNGYPKLKYHASQYDWTVETRKSGQKAGEELVLLLEPAYYSAFSDLSEKTHFALPLILVLVLLKGYALTRDPSSKSKKPKNQPADIGFTRNDSSTILADRQRWTVSERVIGRGGFGTVYQGLDRLNGAIVAVKSLPQGETDRVQSEVKVLARLKHPNIVSYLGSFTVKNQMQLVMEYVPCGSLDQLLGIYGYLPLSALRVYSRDILVGLQYLHDNGILHRDIKPANILTGQDGRCKLADFGLCKVQAVGKAGERWNSEAMRTSPRGTPAYMSPEAINGNPCTGSDVWAVGLTILELSTGHKPWSGLRISQPLALVTSIVKLSAEKGYKLPENIPANFRHFLTRCLLPNPAERASAAELIKNSWTCKQDDLAEAQWLPTGFGDEEASPRAGSRARNSESDSRPVTVSHDLSSYPSSDITFSPAKKAEKAKENAKNPLELSLPASLLDSNRSFVLADAKQPDLPITYVSAAFLDLTGYERDEIVGKNCRFLQGPDTDRSAVKMIRDTITERRESSVALLNYKKDGSRFMNLLHLAPLFDSLGELAFYIGVQTNIQEIKADTGVAPAKVPTPQSLWTEESTNTRVVLSWDLSYSIPRSTSSSSSMLLQEDISNSWHWQSVIHKVSGAAYPGELIALMGPEGCGRNTLGLVLAGRADGRVEGTLHLNGEPADATTGSWITYVPKGGECYQELTAKQVLDLYAGLVLPDLDDAERERNIKKVVADVELTNLEAPSSSLEPVQRKCLNLAIVLLSSPKVLVFDDPLLDLDASRALQYARIWQKVAAAGLTIIVTVSQPTSQVFGVFDRLLLLMDGHVVYQGATNEAVSYFTSHGMQCDLHCNPADYFLGLLSEASRDTELYNKIVTAYENSDMNAGFKQRQQGEERARHNCVGYSQIYQQRTLPRKFWFSFKVICKRDTLVMRSRAYSWWWVGMTAVGVLAGLGSTHRSAFELENLLSLLLLGGAYVLMYHAIHILLDHYDVAYREVAVQGLYDVQTFFIAKTTLSVVLETVGSSLVVSAVYLLAGLPILALPAFLAVTSSIAFYISGVGMAISAISLRDVHKVLCIAVAFMVYTTIPVHVPMPFQGSDPFYVQFLSSLFWCRYPFTDVLAVIPGLGQDTGYGSAQVASLLVAGVIARLVAYLALKKHLKRNSSC